MALLVPLVPRARSLFLRFFSGFALTMLVIWIGVLWYEAVLIQGHFERAQAVETRAWTRQLVVAARPHAANPAQLRAAMQEIAALRDDMYRETGYPQPAWQLQVWHKGALVYSSPATAGAPGAPAHSWVEVDAASGLTVRLAQPVVIAWTFALPATAHQFAPLLYCFPFLLLPAWFSIRRGLGPVKDIVAQIEARSATELSPLGPSAYRELAPLVQSVNALMARLSARLAREQEFLIDAAHQLKTPLAVIQANADVLAGAPYEARSRAAHAGLSEGVQDAAHVTHQLLALARSGSDQGGDAFQICDLAELLRSRLALAAALAIRRGIEIDLRAPEQCSLLLCRSSMAALIDNLVDNAVKYSPDGAVVEVVLEQLDMQSAVFDAITRLRVADHGPGIPAALRGQVFERFFRVPGQDAPGSGLGLAIVENAARRNRATVHLSANPHAGASVSAGLCVTVELQAPGQPASPANSAVDR